MTAEDSNIIPIPATADEETLTTNVYVETQGPRKGIFLTFAKAQRLIDFHLQKQLGDLFYFKRGFNNRVYLARCTDGSEYVIRLGGRFWNHTKITNEVQALKLAKKALGGIVEVPTILGTSIEEAKVHTEESLKIIPYDYIIMSRLPGVPLDSVWDEMSQDDKKTIADQAAEIFARLRSIDINAIGNFVRGPEDQPEVGPLMEGGGGPFQTWGEFVVKNIRNEIKNMQEVADNFVEIVPFLPRLERLIQKVELGELEKQFGNKDELPEGVTEDRPMCFLHGDFESRNMLVIGNRIVGLHDFEFAGGFPAEHEWCAGFEWIFARSEDPYDEDEQEKLRDMTDDQKELLQYFLKVLKDKHGMLQFGVGNQEYKVILYHLQINIAPWWLRDPPRADWTEKQLASMKTAADSLNKALVFLGC
ncbi:hypothetical protein EMPS_00590 [Entomortierella parvispora]|uniref:Aminoglycoside phosphotransferase domain-containing protein n=1 Tax=Entomortierella parvispora TaxID=205924 RepID=A0A9P3LRW2_9FUNG|nr:hypothetical protein EMPS_00590 [Entomortierella parvispora]